MIDARVLFVFQYIVNGTSDKLFPVIGNAAPVEFAKIVALQARKTALNSFILVFSATILRPLTSARTMLT